MMLPESGSSLLYAVAHDVTEKSLREARARQLANAVEQTADASHRVRIPVAIG